MPRTQITENQEVPDTITDSNVASNAGIQLSKLGTGNLTLINQASVIFDDTGSHSLTLEAPTSISSSYTLKWPTAQSSANYFLQNDGSGNLSWAQGGGVGFREDYVVGTALNNYTGSSAVFNLVNSYNVGGHTLIVTLDGDIQTVGSTIDYLETNSTTVTFNNALVTGQKVSFIFSQPPTSTSGIVNSGTASHLSYYASSGTTLSDANSNTINGSYTFSGGAGALTMSGSTIAMGSNKITGLANGTISSDAAAFGQIPVFTSVSSYTPTIVGHGTVSGLSAWYRQMGDVVDVWVTYRCGTVTGTTWSLTVPVTINSSHLPSLTTTLGIINTGDAGTNDGLVVFYDGSDTSKIYSFRPSSGTSTNQFTKQNGNSEFNNSDYVSVRFSYPV